MDDDELEALKVAFAELPPVRTPEEEFFAPRSSKPMEEWRRKADAFARRCEEARRSRKRRETEFVASQSRPSCDDLNALIAAAIEAERNFQKDVLARVIAEERARFRDAIADLKGDGDVVESKRA